MAKLAIVIKKDGKVEIEGQDCTGEVCHRLSRPLEEALGIVEENRDKPELFIDLVEETQSVSEESNE